MTNKYMFFCEQQFENFDLSDYQKNDISIPKTNIHIYEFKCKETEETFDDGSKAKKLDDLTRRLEKDFTDQFITVNSESSQYYCSMLYPLIVSFETKLRYALYISRSLFENGNVNIDSFALEIGKEKKKIEEADFGLIYQSIFTDKDFSAKVKKTVNDMQMTKSDYIKMIQSFEEKTMWQNWVGNDYGFIKENFLGIKSFRNDVMHNHLIDFECYEKAKKMIKKANDTLDRAINDKLIVNDSQYLNDVNIFESLSGAYKMMETFSSAVEGMGKIYSEHSLVGELAAAAKTSPVFSNLSAIAEAAKASAMFRESNALAEAVKASAMFQESNALAEAAKASAAMFHESSALAEAAKASAMFQESNALAEAAKASAMFQESNALAEAAKASAMYQEFSAFQAESNADPAVQKYRAMQAELNAIAVSAAENLANKNSENDLKGVSDKTTKLESDDNSPSTQQNEDGNLKEQGEKEEQTND